MSVLTQMSIVLGFKVQIWQINMPTQWTSRSGATPEMAEQFYQIHRAHQHDGESCSHGVMETTARAPGRQCAP